MKKCATLLLLFISFRLFAQMQPGAVAPDFTLTDINGTSWNLYEILSTGKSVIIDFSATWCHPCWEYHETHHLRHLYEEYGPDGTDELMIFLIEADSATTLADLHGMGIATWGNWVENTPYPIIDDSSLKESYKISGYPTIYLICPNRRVYEQGRLPADDFYAEVQACQESIQPHNAALLKWIGTSGQVCPNYDFVPRITLANNSNSSITSTVIEFRRNGELIQTLKWSGNLPVSQLTEVTFDPVTPDGSATANLDFRIIKVNNQPDPDASDNHLSYVVQTSDKIRAEAFTVSLELGFTAAETYWEIRDVSKGNVVTFGGNEAVGRNGGGMFVSSSLPAGIGTYPAYSEHTIQVPVSRQGGCYEFHLVDARGNGFSSGDSLELTNGSQTLMQAYNNWGRSQTLTLEVSPFINPGLTGVDSFEAFPNPATEELKVYFLLEKPTTLELLLSNTLGEIVFTRQQEVFLPGEHELRIATATLPAGIYFLRLGNGQVSATQKVVVGKT